MTNDIFATKIGMTQAWTKDGKRLAITRCKIGENIVVGKRIIEVNDISSQNKKVISCTLLEVGYGKKKLKNLTKPLRTRIEKSGFDFGVKQIRGIRVFNQDQTGQVSDAATDSTTNDSIPEVGGKLSAKAILSVGDVVQVQGTTRGKGFTGAMKRHGFAGGPKTHGQSDRARAVGSIGAGSSPGRVWPGQKMPGQSGNTTSTVRGLLVVHLDETTGEIWLTGPVPGSINSDIKISKMGKKKEVALDKRASGIEEVAEMAEVAEKTAKAEVAEKIEEGGETEVVEEAEVAKKTEETKAEEKTADAVVSDEAPAPVEDKN